MKNWTGFAEIFKTEPRRIVFEVRKNIAGHDEHKVLQSSAESCDVKEAFCDSISIFPDKINLMHNGQQIDQGRIRIEKTFHPTDLLLRQTSLFLSHSFVLSKLLI